MEELNKQRKERGDLEKAGISMFIKAEEELQSRMEVALQRDFFIDMQFDTDANLIFGKFVEWSKKTKVKKQKDILTSLIKALWRMQEYKGTLKTLSGRATAEYLEERRRNTKIEKRMLEAEKTVKAQAKQIEYYETNKEK